MIDKNYQNNEHSEHTDMSKMSGPNKKESELRKKLGTSHPFI